ncbi:MAG: protein translocase subunit SecD [Clostridia bacterium]|nr:protein translocase subunit SecD [Clostridia bacterium]MBR2057280.1 protein translocase subunit SecD [Clostridia bacterium]MBR2918958.1 protein translocase subunit SecD [Clostridia bacterium]
MSKKKSIIVLSLVAVFIILMAVFAVVDFPIGNTVYDYHGYAKTIKLGLDMSGGVSAVFNVIDDGHPDLDVRIDGTVASLQELLVSKGYTEATVTKGTNSNGMNTIRVEVPDVDDPETVLSLIGRPATLEFKLEESDTAEAVIIGSEHLETAYVTTDDNSAYAVGLKFNDEGTKVFSDMTSANVGKSTYIYINGELYTTVNINSAITNGSAIITSQAGYSFEEAKDFATRLQSGTFGVKLQQAEVRSISPTLGANAVRNALIAGVIGIALIFVFLAVVYRGMGLAADVALCVYIVLLLWFSALLPWVQLTLPGIAGLLLSIGMAVDGNVIIFERIREEYRGTSKPIKSAVKAGFKRSIAAIIDGNVTTLIGAIVLWAVGSAAIQGFAVTLFIGIILSMFTSLLITRLVLNAFLPLTAKLDKKHKGLNEKLYGLKRSASVEEGK